MAENLLKKYGLAVRVSSTRFDVKSNGNFWDRVNRGMVARTNQVVKAFKTLRKTVPNLVGYPYLQVHNVADDVNPAELGGKIAQGAGIFPIFTFLPFPFGRQAEDRGEDYRLRKLQDAVGVFPYVEVLPEDLSKLRESPQTTFICSYFNFDKTPMPSELAKLYGGMYCKAIQSGITRPVLFKFETATHSFHDSGKMLRFVGEHYQPDLWSNGVVGICRGDTHKAYVSRWQTQFHGGRFTIGGAEMERDLKHLDERMDDMIFRSCASKPVTY